MYLKTLGTLDLENPAGARVNALLHQPRRLALLVFLSVESRKGRVRRDTLLAMFWPDTEPARASRSLSQALHYLRSVLGSDSLSEPRQNDIQVNANRCVCDAVQFLGAVEDKQYDAALNLYVGDFLPGFHAGGLPEFQQWVDCQRNQLKRIASESALELAARAAAERDALKAAVLVRRSAELVPFDEAMLNRQMQILSGIGDGTGALKLYDSFQRLLKQEFAAVPSRATAAFAAAIGSPSRAPFIFEPVAHPQQTGTVRARRRVRVPWVSVGSTIAIAAFAALWGWGERATESVSTNPSHVEIALSGFIDYQSADKPQLSRAIAAELSGRIAQVEGWTVTQTTDTNDDSGADGGYELTGGVMHVDSGVRVTAVLANRISSATVAHKVVLLPMSDAGAIVEQAATAVAEFVRTAVGRDRTSRAVRAIRPRAAASLVQLGIAAKERGDSLRELGSSEAAEAALRLADSLFAQAGQTVRGSSLPALLRGETSLRLMWLYLAPPFADPRRAREALERGLVFAQRAVADDAANLDALELRGVLQHWLWQLVPAAAAKQINQYRDGAEADFQRVLREDPRRVRSWALWSAALLSRGEFAAARVAAERAYATDAYLEEWPDVLMRVFSTAIETGDPAAARSWCTEIRRRTQGSFLASYCELALLAQIASPTTQDVQRATALADSRGTGYESMPQLTAHLHMLAALVATRAGDADPAQQLRQLALAESDADPELLPLRALVCDAAGNQPAAITYLRNYIAADPARRSGVSRSSRFSAPVREALTLDHAPVTTVNRQVQYHTPLMRMQVGSPDC